MPWPAGDAAIAVARGRRFPALPVETGIFVIVFENCHFGTEKCGIDQPLTGQFLYPANWEFFGT
jgi:hypothetical protein